MTIPFVRQFEFEYGTPQPVSAHANRIVAQNPGPFTYTGTGTYLIGSGSCVAIIDPGPDIEKHRKALQAALEGRRLTHIFLTHHHADHSQLAWTLGQAYNCPVYGRSPDEYGKDEPEIVLEAGNDPNFRPDIEISDGFTAQGDGWTLMTMWTPGHTSNHLCYALVEDNILFTGDHIMGWATSVVIPPDGDMGAYLLSLARLKAENFSRLIPTHGPAIDDPEPFVSAYIDHRLQREAQIMSALRTGHSNIIDIVKSVYVDTDPGLYPAASLSVLSHLIYLRRRGLVQANGPDGLKTKYYL